MTDINKKILDLINDKASATEIVEATGLSHKQLFYRLSLLKLKGYNFKTKYYYTGDIVYKIIHDILKENNDEYSILTSSKDTNFKALFISDMHLGSDKERLDILNKLYNYCIINNINIIINCGDLIDGLYGQFPKRIGSYDEQIDYAIKNYPFDKNIINFICLGDHDIDSLYKSGQDLGVALAARRHDIVPIGYGTGIINVKNDQIIVRHPKVKNPNIDNVFCNKLILCGHSHRMLTNVGGGNIKINIPSLSDIFVSENEFMPGAVLCDIEFLNGYFKTGVFTHLLISNSKIYRVSESQYEFSVNKNFSRGTISNIDDSYIEKNHKIKVLVKDKKINNKD